MTDINIPGGYGMCSACGIVPMPHDGSGCDHGRAGEKEPVREVTNKDLSAALDRIERLVDELVGRS